MGASVDAGRLDVHLFRLSGIHSAMKSLEGNVAIVTGGTFGVGRGIASALAHCGARVFVTGRSVKEGAPIEDRCFGLSEKVHSLDSSTFLVKHLSGSTICAEPFARDKSDGLRPTNARNSQLPQILLGINIHNISQFTTYFYYDALAVSSEEQRYVLNAALLLLEPKKVSMIATDGHRLAVAEKDEHAGLSGVTTARKLLIPGKALQDLVSLLGSTNAKSLELFADASTRVP